MVIRWSVNVTEKSEQCTISNRIQNKQWNEPKKNTENDWNKREYTRGNRLDFTKWIWNCFHLENMAMRCCSQETRIEIDNPMKIGMYVCSLSLPLLFLLTSLGRWTRSRTKQTIFYYTVPRIRCRVQRDRRWKHLGKIPKWCLIVSKPKKNRSFRKRRKVTNTRNHCDNK